MAFIESAKLSSGFTEQMQLHYSSVQLDDRRAAIALLDQHLKKAKVEAKVEGQVEGRPENEKGRDLVDENAA